jgi:Tol biopolymer transport system component/streptogramin lyase
MMSARSRYGSGSAKRVRRIAATSIIVGLLVAIGPSVSAQGTINGRIAFTTDRDSSGGVRNREVYSMNPDGSDQINLTNNPSQDRAPAWSPDGTKIVFSSDRYGAEDVFLMNADGSHQTRLTNHPADDFTPNWSPDGKQVIFATLRDGNAEIYVMKMDGTGQTNLTNSPGNDLAPNWAPDGSKIIFGSDRTGNFEIFSMNPDGSQPTNITQTPSAELEASFSPDSSKIAFVSNETNNADIWVMNADGSDRTQLTTDPANDFISAWSPDGTMIAFGSFRTSDEEIWVMNSADGSAQTNLTNTSPALDFLPSWQRLGVVLPPDWAPVPDPGPQPPPVPSTPFSFLFLNGDANLEGNTFFFDLMIMGPPNTRAIGVGFATLQMFPQDCAPFACATAEADYLTRSGLIVFNPGETFKRIAIPVLKDKVREPNEVFLTVIFNPLGGASPDTLINRGNVGRIINQKPPKKFAGHGFAEEFRAGFTGHPAGMKLGPDGNFWLTEQFDQKIAKFNPKTRVATEIDVPGTFPHNFAVGPDKNMWFVGLADVVGRVKPKTGEITLFRQGISEGATPHIILTGPDGNMWFTESYGGIPDPIPGSPPHGHGDGSIARLNIKTGAITEFKDGLPEHNFLHGMTVGPDGHLWVALQGVDQIARFNMKTEKFDKFVDFSPHSGPIDIETGPDGKLYVTLQFINKLGQYDPKTHKVKEIDKWSHGHGSKPNPREIATSLVPLDGPSVDQLIADKERRVIWFSEFLNDRVGMYDIDTGRVLEFTQGITPNSAPLGLALGPDRHLWFSQVSLNPFVPGGIARLTLAHDKKDKDKKH